MIGMQAGLWIEQSEFEWQVATVVFIGKANQWFTFVLAVYPEA